MENLLTFSELEEIIRTAIKLSCFSARDIAEEISMSNSGMYCFTSGKNHISVSKGDEIIKFLKEKCPMALQASMNVFFNN